MNLTWSDPVDGLGHTSYRAYPGASRSPGARSEEAGPAELSTRKTEFGKRLVQLRQHQKVPLSQKNVLVALEDGYRRRTVSKTLSSGALSRYENGHRTPDADTLDALLWVYQPPPHVRTELREERRHLAELSSARGRTDAEPGDTESEPHHRQPDTGAGGKQPRRSTISWQRGSIISLSIFAAIVIVVLLINSITGWPGSGSTADGSSMSTAASPESAAAPSASAGSPSSANSSKFRADRRHGVAKLQYFGKGWVSRSCLKAP